MSVGEPRRFSSSGGAIAYTDDGEGPVVLLLHGFPLWSREWAELSSLLSTRFRVIAPDLLGAGDSDMPADVPLGCRAQTGYVRELLAHLDVTGFAVVGRSTGGVLAQLLALEGAGVEAMVLLAGPAIDAEGRSLTGAGGMSADPTAVGAAVRAMLHEATVQRGRLSDELVAALAAPYVAEPDAFVRMRTALEIEDAGHGADELSRIEFPVLILWGEDDPIYPVAEADRINEAMPSSTLGLLPGCGHFLLIEAIDTIGPMISEYLRARWLLAPHGHADTSGVVTIQLERRPPWADLEEAESWFDDGPAPTLPDPADQEVGPMGGA